MPGRNEKQSFCKIFCGANNLHYGKCGSGALKNKKRHSHVPVCVPVLLVFIRVLTVCYSNLKSQWYKTPNCYYTYWFTRRNFDLITVPSAKNKIVRSAKSERLCELHLQSLADDLKKLARQVYPRTFTVMWHETPTCKLKYHLHLRYSEKNKDAARSASFLLLVKFCT